MNGTLNLLFKDPDSAWHVTFDDQRKRVGIHAGEDPDASATATMKTEHFLALLGGEMSYMQAQMTGKVRFRGTGEFGMFLGIIPAAFAQVKRARGLRGLPLRLYSAAVLASAGRSPGDPRRILLGPPRRDGGRRGAGSESAGETAASRKRWTVCGLLGRRRARGER